MNIDFVKVKEFALLEMIGAMLLKKEKDAKMVQCVKYPLIIKIM